MKNIIQVDTAEEKKKYIYDCSKFGLVDVFGD